MGLDDTLFNAGYGSLESLDGDVIRSPSHRARSLRGRGRSITVCTGMGHRKIKVCYGLWKVSWSNQSVVQAIESILIKS
jgi:hypothetical protein